MNLSYKCRKKLSRQTKLPQLLLIIPFVFSFCQWFPYCIETLKFLWSHLVIFAFVAIDVKCKSYQEAHPLFFWKYS